MLSYALNQDDFFFLFAIVIVINTDNVATHASEIMDNKLAAAVAPVHPELPEYEKLFQ